MLTMYHKNSSFKKKFSVVIIWLIAIVMLSALINFINSTALSIWITIIPTLVALIVIAGIVLRCKIARGFTLVAVYIMMLLPFMTAVMKDTPINLTQAFYSVLFGLLAIYVLSNEKAMDLFYIESNPKEHLFYTIGAAVLTWGYLFFI
ncbi:hypothetical protein KKC13_07565 [bacterium]|nr:hypothetical protein [bacterium]MBU1958231.1 hypothetical protein [bacterium]